MPRSIRGLMVCCCFPGALCADMRFSDQALQEIEAQLAAVEREETRRNLESQQQTVNAALAASQSLAGGFTGLRLGGSVNIEDLYNGLTADNARHGIDLTT